MRTALDHAREMWEKEGWPPPQDATDEALYCLFFTDRMPSDKGVLGGWTRPPKWVEHLVRGPGYVVV